MQGSTDDSTFEIIDVLYTLSQHIYSFNSSTTDSQALDSNFITSVLLPIKL